MLITILIQPITSSNSISIVVNDQLVNRNLTIQAIFPDTTIQVEEQNNVPHSNLPMNSRNILKWKYPTAEGSDISTPALVDLDNDDDLEVVFITEGDEVYAISNTGTFLWKNTDYTITRADEFMTGGASINYYIPKTFSSVTPADIAGNDNIELLFCANNEIVCLDSAGNEVWTAGDSNRNYISTPVVTDLEGNLSSGKSDLEIVVLRDNTYNEINPEIYSASGNLISTLSRPGNWQEVGLGSVAAFDLDNDSQVDTWQDIIFGSRGSPIRLYSYNVTQYERVIPQSTNVLCVIYGTGAVGDFVSDSELEYFIGTYEAPWGSLNNPSASTGRCYLYDPINDTASWEQQYRLWQSSLPTTASGIFGSPAVGDVQCGLPNPATGKVGYEGFVGAYNGNFYCIDLNTGNILWSYDTGDNIYTSPALCNIGSENSLEVVFATSNGIIYCFDGDPSDNIDEGVIDGGGTNYDKLWEYNTGGNGSWVSSPVVADIDNDKNLEVIIGDSDGIVWCLNAGSVESTGQVDWPMFQHNEQNTGVFPPRIKSFNISMELLNGDSPGERDCYSQYKPYNFRVKVNDGMGYKDLQEVILKFDPLGLNTQCKWSQKTKHFTMINNPELAIKVISNTSDSVSDKLRTWTIDFKVIFNWNFEVTRPITCSIESIGEANPAHSVYYKDFINVENELEFIGNLTLSSGFQGEIESGDWVRGGENVSISNLIIVYKETENVYPDISKYKLVVKDDKGTSQEFPPKRPGEMVGITIEMPEITDSKRIFNLNTTTIPEVANWENIGLEFIIRIDNTLPTAPPQVMIHADSYTDTNTIADNDTNVYITWTSPAQVLSGIKGYYYSTTDNSGTNNGYFTSDNFGEHHFDEQGLHSIYVWAEDMVGNIGAANSASIFIDMENITFSSYYPTTQNWINTNTIHTGVDILDTNGIGVDPSTIQYSIKPSDSSSFNPWKAINQDIDLLWVNPTNVRVNTSITFSERGINLLRWRAKDLAGNGYTISESYKLLIDDIPPTFSNHRASPAAVDDLRWVSCNITIIDEGGSGVDGSSIEYRYSASGIGNYSDWINANKKLNINKIEVNTTLLFNYGDNNYICWRVKDIAGNNYVYSGDIQIKVNIPPVININLPKNNTRFYIDNLIEFDASGSYDPDEADILSYYWTTTYTNNIGQKNTMLLGKSFNFKRGLETGYNQIILYISDGNYNISKSVNIFVYNKYTDTDKDGMPDWWEDQYVGLDFNNPFDAHSDLDNDGFMNIEEFLKETNPADPNDYPGKAEEKDDDKTFSTALIINIIVLIIVIVFLTSFFLIRRSKLKKELFEERGISAAPVMLRRGQPGVQPELRGSGTPQLFTRPGAAGAGMQTGQPQLGPAGVGFAAGAGGPGQPAVQAPLPQLPPHMPTIDSETQTLEQEQVQATSTTPTTLTTPTISTTTPTSPTQTPPAPTPTVTQAPSPTPSQSPEPQTTTTPTISETPTKNKTTIEPSGGDDL